MGNEDNRFAVNESSERERTKDGSSRGGGRRVYAGSTLVGVDSTSHGGGNGGGGGLCREGGVSVPGWCNGDVDLNVVDNDDCWLGEVLAGGDGVDPETGLLVFVDVALIRVLEVGSNVFVDDEVFVLLAPFLIRADILGGAEFDIVVPCWSSNCYDFGSAGIDTGG